nr:stimulator of interferon genes protein [Andrias davidianus]
MNRASEKLNFQDNQIIPNERGNQARITAGIVIILLIIFLGFSEIYKYDIKYIFSLVVLQLIMMEGMAFLKGVCDLTEERYHLNTRYHGKLTEAVKACVNVKHLPILLFGGCFLIQLSNTDELLKLPLSMTITLTSICQLVYIALGFQIPTQVAISEICEKNKLNVAHGLAWSYYLGYLKIILPGFKESVRQFKEANGNLLRCEDTCKLHILIPLSCKVYHDLESADSNIQFFKDLPPLQTDRAGIKERVYKNSMYSIFDEEARPNYCVVEYATPLLSLHQMSNISSAAFSSEDRIQQAKLFYRTLENILETSLEPECRNSYRLIPYDDCQVNDKEESNSHFLSTLILKHMLQQQGEEYSMEK